MRTYHQLTSGERYELSALRKQGLKPAAIAAVLGRHRSTIFREIRRNSRKDGGYRPSTAGEMTRGRRSRSRRTPHFNPAQWALVVEFLKQLWSPEQISGRLALEGRLCISHETIYRYIWRDHVRGGDLHRYLRQSIKQKRKRYGRYDSRGRLAGKRMISERPPDVENRSRIGHFEGDTMIGASDKHCVLTLVERKTGYVLIGKLKQRTVRETNQRAISLMRRTRHRARTLTLDNGTEFHGYKAIEAATKATVYFATPHHSWERGTAENTNGLIRQYLPKRRSMAQIDQRTCSRIAAHLNARPRKRLGYRTPAELYECCDDADAVRSTGVFPDAVPQRASPSDVLSPGARGEVRAPACCCTSGLNSSRQATATPTFAGSRCRTAAHTLAPPGCRSRHSSREMR
jgi:transposase, IS30 family